jgi:hypothetical protein
MTSKARSRRKSSASKKTHRYSCPNPGRPFCLKAIVKKILKDKVFAKFIAEQLCKAHGGDEGAIRCVDSYFKPTDDELDAICVPRPKRAELRNCRCTDTHKLLLIDAIAHGAAGIRKR